MLEHLRELARSVLTGWLFRLRPPGETWEEQIDRRLAAVETHLQHLPPERTM